MGQHKFIVINDAAGQTETEKLRGQAERLQGQAEGAETTSL